MVTDAGSSDLVCPGQLSGIQWYLSLFGLNSVTLKYFSSLALLGKARLFLLRGCHGTGGTEEAPGAVVSLGWHMDSIVLSSCDCWVLVKTPQWYSLSIPDPHLRTCSIYAVSIFTSTILIKLFPWDLGEFDCSPHSCWCLHDPGRLPPASHPPPSGLDALHSHWCSVSSSAWIASAPELRVQGQHQPLFFFDFLKPIWEFNCLFSQDVLSIISLS